MATTRQPDPEKGQPERIVTPEVKAQPAVKATEAAARAGKPVRMAEAPPVGDEATVGECLQALGRITDPGSLATIKAAVDGRVGPEKKDA